MLILKLAFEVITFAAHFSAFGALAVPLQALHTRSPLDPKNPWRQDAGVPDWDDIVFRKNNALQNGFATIVGQERKLEDLELPNLIAIWEQLGAVRYMLGKPDHAAYKGSDNNLKELAKLDIQTAQTMLDTTSLEVHRRLTRLNLQRLQELSNEITVMLQPGEHSVGSNRYRRLEVDKHMLDALGNLAQGVIRELKRFNLKNPWRSGVGVPGPDWNDNVFRKNSALQHGFATIVGQGQKLEEYIKRLSLQNLLAIWEQLGAVRCMLGKPDHAAYRGSDNNLKELAKLDIHTAQTMVSTTSLEVRRRLRSLRREELQGLLHDTTVGAMKQGGYVVADTSNPYQTGLHFEVNEHMSDALRDLALPE